MQSKTLKPTARETELLEALMNIYELCGTSTFISSAEVLKEIQKVVLPKDPRNG